MRTIILKPKPVTVTKYTTDDEAYTEFYILCRRVGGIRKYMRDIMNDMIRWIRKHELLPDVFFLDINREQDMKIRKLVEDGGYYSKHELINKWVREKLETVQE